MRICLISEEFPPETGWGGIGTHTYNLSLALSELGHAVHVLTKSVNGREYNSENGNLHICRISETGGESLSLDTISKVVPKIQVNRLLAGFNEYPLKALRRGAAVSKWLKNKQPFDIIEAPDYGAETFWCQFFERINTPIVIKLHTPLFLTQRLNSVPKEDISVKLRKWMEKYSVIHATSVISPTKSLAEMISREFHIDGISVIPNCIDTDFFEFKEKDTEKKEKIVLYAGRLERRKGVEVLAKTIPLVVKSIPEVKFIFVGRDTPTAEEGTSMKSWLEDYFERAGIRDYVELSGEKRRTEIPTYYQRADICVLPSIWENLPYTCLEAMSCGTPVVASNVGGFAEIITDGIDGFLFKAGNYTDLSRQVITALKLKDLREFSRRARKKIENTYSHRAIAAKTIEHYENVIRMIRK